MWPVTRIESNYKRDTKGTRVGSTNHRKGPKGAEKGRKGPKRAEKERKEPNLRTENDQKEFDKKSRKELDRSEKNYY